MKRPDQIKDRIRYLEAQKKIYLEKATKEQGKGSKFNIEAHIELMKFAVQINTLNWVLNNKM